MSAPYLLLPTTRVCRVGQSVHNFCPPFQEFVHKFPPADFFLRTFFTGTISPLPVGEHHGYPSVPPLPELFRGLSFKVRGVWLVSMQIFSIITQGTRSYHNFTKRVKSTEGQAQRYITAFTCSEPYMQDGLEAPVPTPIHVGIGLPDAQRLET